MSAHEFFHAWNVKRIRPVELGPFDYEHEVRTVNLWWSEGVTDFFASELLRHTTVDAAPLTGDSAARADFAANIAAYLGKTRLIDNAILP